MDVKFGCDGFWTADEIADVVEAEFGFRPEVSTSNNEVIVHPRPRGLEKQEVKWLRKYLEEHSQKSSEERMVEQEQAQELRRQERIARVSKVTEASGISVNVDDLKDALRALAELAGVEVSRVSARGTTNQNI